MQQQTFDQLYTPPSQHSWFHEMLTSLGIENRTCWPDRFGEEIYKRLTASNYEPVRVLSLFSGGGGLDIAFHDAGFKVLQMIEVEPRYVETLKTNRGVGKPLGDAQALCIDIRNYTPDPGMSVDFIIGGPPCQTFSAAGRRAAGVQGIDDPRGTLFEEYVRLLRELRPKGFLFENVYGITGAQNGRAWQEIQDAFKDAGYKIHFRVLDAADYGVPQHRERLFIVGLQEGDYLFPYPTHGPESIGQQPFYSAGQAVEAAEITSAKGGITGQYGHLLNDIPPGLNYSFYTREMGHPRPIFSWRSKFSDFLYKADPDSPVRTIKAQGGQYTGPFSWENRPFTIGELKRLQTIPDSYNIMGGRGATIEQIGNSVPPQLGRILALSILDQVMNYKLPFPMHYLPVYKELGFRQRKRALTEQYLSTARRAIANLQQNTQAASPTPNAEAGSIRGVMTRFLSPRFTWTPNAVPKSTGVDIVYELDGSSWEIKAGVSGQWLTGQKYVITVSPMSSHSWPLHTEIVRLSAIDLNESLFTALWKAFEEKLREQTGIADLVQFFGYYQYSSRIQANMTFLTDPEDELWRAIQYIIRGVSVASQMSSDQLAESWGITPDRLLPILRSLRAIGYEVRSHSTNPQIKAEDYLIPYNFPTLTNRSVQLHKSLEADNG